jgi:LmbE family N-acetylglucosaminyl deacetylase
MEENVLAILAHPDDAEILCAGTLSLLKKKGWSVHIATLTTGDKGTTHHTREEIAHIRNAEAVRSAGIIGASYSCLGFEDIYLFYNRETINKTTSLIRRIRPVIVFTSSPEDYMLDHEITSLIAQTACFSAGIKNMDIPEEPYEFIPYLYYCDPLEGKDKYGQEIRPSLYVDISEVIDIKEKMLSCHESQRSWLLSHQEREYIGLMKRLSEKRGKEIGVEYAEGFRQHLGHGYPSGNILKEILGDRVAERE